MRSYLEETIAAWLTKNNIKYDYEPTKFPYKSRITNGHCEVCGAAAVQLREYTPDFWFPDFGFYLECKGQFSSGDRKKMRDVKRSNPDLDVRMLFQANNLITAGDRGGQRYSDWCEKFKFPYSLHSLNSGWFARRT